MSIKEEIHALSDEMITNLGRLVAIDSQLGTPAEGMPFGEGPAKALSEGLKIAQELGFHTVNLDNYCGYAEMGEGEEIVGIAGHLDIVPVGGDWTHDPFKLTREGDYVYGRGTTDDKGPVLEALYAMKLLRDSGVKLNKRVRLIMGCNEETGSKCMEHYNEVAEELSCGFTPDANFPCIHGEKGHMSMMAGSAEALIIFIRKTRDQIQMLMNILSSVNGRHNFLQLVHIHDTVNGPDCLRIRRLYPDLQLCQSRTEAVQQDNLLFPQNVRGNLEMEVCDAIVMFVNIPPDLHGMFVITIERPVNELHLFYVLIQEKLQFSFYDIYVT